MHHWASMHGAVPTPDRILHKNASSCMDHMIVTCPAAHQTKEAHLHPCQAGRQLQSRQETKEGVQIDQELHLHKAAAAAWLRTSMGINCSVVPGMADSTEVLDPGGCLWVILTGG